jgi:hypothetical protein
MALEPLQVHGNLVGEFDSNDIDRAGHCGRPAGSNRIDIGRPPDYSFGEQEARRQLVVVPRRTHRDRDALLLTFAIGARIAESNLQGLFGRYIIG